MDGNVQFNANITKIFNIHTEPRCPNQTCDAILKLVKYDGPIKEYIGTMWFRCTNEGCLGSKVILEEPPEGKIQKKEKKEERKKMKTKTKHIYSRCTYMADDITFLADAHIWVTIDGRTYITEKGYTNDAVFLGGSKLL